MDRHRGMFRIYQLQAGIGVLRAFIFDERAGTSIARKHILVVMYLMSAGTYTYNGIDEGLDSGHLLDRWAVVIWLLIIDDPVLGIFISKPDSMSFLRKSSLC